MATGKDDAPVTNVSWSDAKQFVAWLAARRESPTGFRAKLNGNMPRAGGTQTKYWWGDQFQSGMANCKNCADVAAAEQPVKVGSFKPNPFGLYDMGGGVDQWVEDCWHKNYQGAPADGSAWVDGDASPTSFGPAPGGTTRAMSGRQTATVTTPTCDIRPMGSASHCPRKSIEEGGVS